MKIGIDCDGVMYDFHTPFLGWLYQTGWFEDRNIPRPPVSFEPQHWGFYKEWGMTEEEFHEQCNISVDYEHLFKVGEPIPGTKRVMDYLKNEGHSLHIITHRHFGERSTHNTVDWLAQYEIPFDTITFAQDKTIVGVDLLLDDYEGNWRSSIRQGIPCVLMDQPWNRHVTTARRVAGWEEFASMIDLAEVLGASTWDSVADFFT